MPCTSICIYMHLYAVEPALHQVQRRSLQLQLMRHRAYDMFVRVSANTPVGYDSASTLTVLCFLSVPHLKEIFSSAFLLLCSTQWSCELQNW